MARRCNLLSILKLAFPSNFVSTFRPVCLSFPVITVIMYVIMITRNYCHIQHKLNIFFVVAGSSFTPSPRFWNLTIKCAYPDFIPVRYNPSNWTVQFFTLWRVTTTRKHEYHVTAGHTWRSWLRHCLTNRKAADSIPFRSHYDHGIDLNSNRNEYQGYLLGVKAGGA